MVADAQVFCAQCGEGYAAAAAACPSCGAANIAAGRRRTSATSALADGTVSERSYAVAVSLCGIFGILGIHHFYLGNILHGLVDLGLFLAAMYCLLIAADDTPDWIILGGLLLAADLLHTMIVFYRLITGQAHDGRGRRIAVPGGRP